MPSGDPIGPRGKLKKKKPVTDTRPVSSPVRPDIQTKGKTGTGYTKPKAKKTVTRAPISDVRSSGRDYSKKTVEAYKRTAEYKRIVKEAKERDQAARERLALIALADSKGRVAKDVDVGSVTSAAADAFMRVYGKGDGSTGKRGSGAVAALTMAPGKTTASRLVLGTGKATLEEPGKTAKGLGQAVVGTVGAVGDIVLPLLDPNPTHLPRNLKKSGQGVERLAKGVVEDYSRRYGDLVRGDDESLERWRKRLKEEGAGPEVLDLAAGAAVGGKVLRPAVRATIKRVPGGKDFLEAPRPDLRTSGGTVEKQTVSKKPTRVVLQRTQDKVRAYATDHPGRVLGRRHRPDDDGRTPALRPRVSPNDKATLKAIKRHNKKAEKRGGRKVTAGPEVVPLSARAAAKKQRVAVSRTSSKAYVANKHEQAIELANGAERALASLDAKQRRAVFHVVQGLVPLARSLPEIKAVLKERRAQLVKAGAPKGARVLRSKTELATIDFLLKNADEVFGDGRLQGFHAGEVERGKRVAAGDPALRSATQEARRYRPQGEFLGVKYNPPKARKVDGKKIDPTPAERDAYNRAYVAEVKAKAEARGLPEPAYFKHEKRVQVRLSARTSGNVAKAPQGPKASKMTLFKEGRAVTSPEMYVQGMAETIKRKHQWAAVADAAAEHAFDWSRGKHGEGRSVGELRDLIDQRGLRHEDVAFINFGRFHRIAEELDPKVAESPKHFGEAVQDAVMTPERAELLGSTGDLPATRGYVAVPRAAADEILAATRPAGKPTRVFGRAQGLQSAAILGLNPSWLQMQVAANMLQSGIGMRGNLLDYARSQLWYRNLTPEAKKLVDQELGIGVLEGHTNTAHLGYYQGPISRAFEQIGQIPVVRTKNGTIRVTDANPVRLMFRADRAQTAAFRRAVLYNNLKRQQFQELARKVGIAQASIRQLADMFKGNYADQLANVLKDPHKVEAAARHVDDVLGDYLRYTARERRMFKPYVMFYGFLRYATKTLFYTLPVKHPVLGAIALKLGQLHAEEVYRIFGTRDVPEWALSRSYEYDENGEVKRDDRGRPMYRDLARINPITSPVTDLLSEGPQVLAGMVSPLFQGAADVIAGESVATHIPLRLHGDTAKVDGLSPLDIAKVILNRGAKSTLPGRALMAGHGTQGDDALPFFPAPLEYKTEAARQRDIQRSADQPSLTTQLFPLFNPRVDTTQDFMNRHDLGPVAKFSAALEILKTYKEALEKSGKHVVGGGTVKTREYDTLLTGIAELEAAKRAVVNEARAKPKPRLKPPAKTDEERQLEKFNRRLERLSATDRDLERFSERLERLAGG